MARRPQSVRRLLKDKPTLRFLELEISAQKVILDSVRRLLPDDLASHCVAAQRRDQSLVLHVDSPVWATRLRYASPGLLDMLKPAYPWLRAIKIKLLLSRADSRRRPATARHSDSAAAIIHDSAQETKQAQLRNALERLSQALKRHKAR
jgi:hypothetical protein